MGLLVPERTSLHIKKPNRSLLGEARMCFHSHIEYMVTYEYANELKNKLHI